MSQFPWSATDAEEITRLWAEGIPTRDIARKLNRTLGAVCRKARTLGLPFRQKGRPPSAIWAPAVDDALRARWNLCSTEVLAAHLGFHPDTIRRRAKELGL